ncbi:MULTISPECIES: aminotransferase class I/II-fold pyridoxal phosphate-dependent enzyme [unclassified Sporosarcina]|uniref:aminotransferase class I/II-fold pyridoxal phosphate-dependent enzyme n=1 Tax=unclassified Sporosarcina TaxID=2647733 RepID=UPI000C16DBE5|nr:MULTISPECIES: aminotransferase class V-fold PLP-dependent enzyme [unclassified Sporosarcina]PIC98669.1 lysine decarboxylase [Sporosarcina sp. P29]PID05065.1 lysine decarboxylase [Sporosarcina sp. P30]PID08262.1 lysine decarboxylase [Sporosarcina sp. P31]PID11341.1 lysine decarboxylase [Sporosarcina sp. P32b]
MKYQDRPLVQALQNFHDRKPVSFHVPGHKGGALSNLPVAVRQALAYDLTELTGLDDLHEPSAAIKEAEDKLACLYGSERSFFLVNGSTVGNLAMLYATVRPGDLVMVQRNAHKSIFNALELTGANPVFLSPDWDELTQTAGTVSLKTVKEALTQYPNVKAAVFTTPTYYGILNKDLEQIIEVCHSSSIPVLVDEAHGAHFIVHDAFPTSALELGADLVVHSAHKTLPAMTMASFLHIHSQFVKMERVAHYLQMLQSSSPSYLLMASLDDARYYAETYDEKDFESFQLYRRNLIRDLCNMAGVEVVETDDQLKLLIRATGHTGYVLQEALEHQDIYPELADLYQVLLVLPLVKVGDGKRYIDVVDKFKVAMNCLAEKKTTSVRIHNYLSKSSPSTVVYTASQLHTMDMEWLNMQSATGRVAADAIIPYPPGIPLLCAGERISHEHMEQIDDLLMAGCRFQGAINKETKQIKVVVE